MDVVIEGHHSRCVCELCSDVRAVLGKDPLGSSSHLAHRTHGFTMHDYHIRGSTELRAENGYERGSLEYILHAPYAFENEEGGVPPFNTNAAHFLLITGFRWASKLYNFLYSG